MIEDSIIGTAPVVLNALQNDVTNIADMIEVDELIDKYNDYIYIYLILNCFHTYYYVKQGQKFFGVRLPVKVVIRSECLLYATSQ